MPVSSSSWEESQKDWSRSKFSMQWFINPRMNKKESLICFLCSFRVRYKKIIIQKGRDCFLCSFRVIQKKITIQKGRDWGQHLENSIIAEPQLHSIGKDAARKLHALSYFWCWALKLHLKRHSSSVPKNRSRPCPPLSRVLHNLAIFERFGVWKRQSLSKLWETGAQHHLTTDGWK